ncbi:MAG: conjugal transfer transcriptional regulator TraJ [Thiobacillus sp.]|nr:conjugal transfer transcriptional regulator TraJ [Thiobacillus sp.]
MSDNKKPATRKASPPIKVYCLPEERARIEANAEAAGLSLSAYLLAVGQGYAVQGVMDYEKVRELAAINGDLGRLGGLLKLWLTDDIRTAHFGESTIRALLGRIERTQDQMTGVMRAVVRPRRAADLAAKPEDGEGGS